jgi:cardiolipin synthase
MLLKRFGFRDHRKMLVCDSQTAFIGGFNITSEYVGDGIASGWCDIGLRLECPLAADFAIAFDEMFARADFQHKPFTRLRKTGAKRGVSGADAELLLSGPGRGHNPFKSRLHQDLKKARLVQIISAYFLPTWRIRRDLARIARHGGKVQLMLPAKSDVLLSQLATQSLYRRLMRSGVEIYEYQPQILHAKLIIVDGVAYAGSSNLDPRSLFINYEVMVRCTKTSAVAEAAEVFQEKLAHCRRIQLDAWRASRTWWQRLRDRWAYFILVRMDPVFARWQYRHMQE